MAIFPKRVIPAEKGARETQPPSKLRSMSSALVNRTVRALAPFAVVVGGGVVDAFSTMHSDSDLQLELPLDELDAGESGLQHNIDLQEKESFTHDAFFWGKQIEGRPLSTKP